MNFIQIAKIDKVFLKRTAFEYGSEGTLHLTAHHLIFVNTNDVTATKEHWIPYPTISHLIRPQHNTLDYNLDIITRHFCFFRFTIPLIALDSVYLSLVKLVHIESIDQLYAFSYINTQDISDNIGWSWFNMEQEYIRQGIQNTPYWRISTLNSDYSLCKSYPSILATPSDILDTTLRHVAKHRSRNRIPVLTYLHMSGASLSRCAQPLVGVKANRSFQDEKLVHSIFAQPILNQDSTSLNLIVDARPAINAAANHVKGSGSEIMEYYRNAVKEYIPIENIHVMRESITKILNVMQQSVLEGTPLTVTDLDKSNWLYHIQLLLEGTDLIVSTLKSAHVLVHCSDGWDRTSQLCSLAQICMDPFFRTIKGLGVLIEKDWLAFGHKFSDRSGHITPKAGTSLLANGLVKSLLAKMETSVEQREISPVFHQFLDCVFQLCSTYKSAFEFNTKLLEDLHFHTYACQFGTFIYNSEAERASAHASTHSVWSYVNSNLHLYTNQAYILQTDPISAKVPKLQYWLNVFCSSGYKPSDLDQFCVIPPNTAYVSSYIPKSQNGLDYSSTTTTTTSSIASSMANASVALGSAAVGSVRGLWSRMNMSSLPYTPDAQIIRVPDVYPDIIITSNTTTINTEDDRQASPEAVHLPIPSNMTFDLEMGPGLSSTVDPLGHTDLESISTISATTRGAVRSAGSVS